MNHVAGNFNRHQKVKHGILDAADDSKETEVAHILESMQGQVDSPADDGKCSDTADSCSSLVSEPKAEFLDSSPQTDAPSNGSLDYLSQHAAETTPPSSLDEAYPCSNSSSPLKKKRKSVPRKALKFDWDRLSAEQQAKFHHQLFTAGGGAGGGDGPCSGGGDGGEQGQDGGGGQLDSRNVSQRTVALASRHPNNTTIAGHPSHNDNHSPSLNTHSSHGSHLSLSQNGSIAHQRSLTQDHTTFAHAQIGLDSTNHELIGQIDSIGHTSIGHSPIGQSPIGHSPIGQSPIGHSPIGQSSIGHSPIGHSSIGHSSFSHSTAPMSHDPIAGVSNPLLSSHPGAVLQS